MKITFNKLYGYLKGKSTKVNIVIGIVIILIFNFGLVPALSTIFNDSSFMASNLLDVHFSYTPLSVQATLANMGEKGRHSYLLFETLIDLPYAIIYGFTYSILVIKLYENVGIKSLRYLFIFALFISVFDILENSCIILTLLHFPDYNSTLITLSSIFTSTKWIFALLYAIIVMIGIGITIKYQIKKYNQ